MKARRFVVTQVSTALACAAAGIFLCQPHAAAQDATPTPTLAFTRRPTPTPTVTMTPTSTAVPEAVLICSGGQNDGMPCGDQALFIPNDLDCPGGACVLGQNVCNGGTDDGFDCNTNADCGGGTCILSQRVCNAGESKGFACVVSGHCPGGACVANGLFCYGGVYDRFACGDSADCVDQSDTTGTCRAPAEPLPDQLICTGGDNDGDPCNVDLDCPSGACVFAQNVCNGGEFSDGNFCFSDTDCDPGITCTPSQRICSGGDFKSLACLRNDHCNGAACITNGLFCYGGIFDRFGCVDSADCMLPGQEVGTCRAPAEPLPDSFLCNGGGNDGAECFGPSDCPGGACVLAQYVCNGGDNDGDQCSADTDCSAGIACTPSQKVCSAGEFRGFGCLNDGHCSAASCISTGRFCDGGDYDDFPIPCNDSTDCTATGGTPGSCEVPVSLLLLCSAGTNDGMSCQGDDDCPDGSCVATQGVCGGGRNDSFPCDSNADCPGGSCAPAFQVCDGGDFPGFPCLNDDQCTGDPSGHCFSSGNVCHGGPFNTFGCLDDFNCNCDPADDTCIDLGELAGACEGLIPRACTLEVPCALEQVAEQQVFGPSAVSPDDPVVPGSADYYLSSIPSGAAGLELALRASGGDADLYVGKSPSNILSTYDFSSARSSETTEVIRIDPFSQPETFETFIAGLTQIAVTVVGFDLSPVYRLDALYLRSTQPGDANCDAAADQDDVNGLVRLLFDPATRFDCQGLGRGLGADANSDGAETSADLVATIRASRAPM